MVRLLVLVLVGARQMLLSVVVCIVPPLQLLAVDEGWQRTRQMVTMSPMARLRRRLALRMLRGLFALSSADADATGVGGAGGDGTCC